MYHENYVLNYVHVNEKKPHRVVYREYWQTSGLNKRCKIFPKLLVRGKVLSFNTQLVPLSKYIRHEVIFELIVSATRNRVSLRMPN